MAIDTNEEIEAGFWKRWMSVGQLKKCIEGLDDADVVSPNRVGNLTVTDDVEQRMIGYVDFYGEQFTAVELTK